MNKTKKTRITNKLKQNRGITLVALVITIVVLIILATISIAVTFGEGGITPRAEQAKAHQANAEAEDLERMGILESKIESKEPIPVEEDIEKLTKIQPRTIKTYDENKDPVIVPKGFKVRTDLGTSTKTGIVIEDSNKNEFVYVPVRDITDIYDKERQAGQLWDFGTYTTPKNPAIKRAYPTTQNSGYREPDVVTGATSGSNSTSGNSYDAVNLQEAEFVSDLDKDGKVDAKDFKIQLQKEFNSMIDSIETYGGFYIGRYETGNLSKSEAVVQKGNIDLGGQTWYTMYKLSKKIAKQNTNVTTSMIWGCQWDATLRWMQKEGTTDKVKNFATNSVNYGNYQDNSISYVDTDEQTKTTTAGTAERIPTGSAEITNINNIYDMAGNVFEWSIEAYDTDYRVCRGGKYYTSIGSDRPASSRYNYVPTVGESGYGCRATLYIK